MAYDSYAPDFEVGPHTSQFLRTSNYVLYEYPPVKLQEAGVEFVFTTYDPKSDPASHFVPVEDWIEFTHNYQLVKAFLSQPELLRRRSIWVYEAIPVQ